MSEKQINRWLRRQFSEMNWVLLGYYVLVNVLVMAMMVTDFLKQMLWNLQTGNFLLDVDEKVLAGNGWGYMITIAAALCILHAWKGRDYWKREIFAKEKKMTFFPAFCAVTFCMGSQMVSSLWLTVLELIMNGFGSSLLPQLEAVSGSSTSFSMFLYSAVFAPFFEEILFRGYVLRTLRPYGKRFSILFSALLFGLFHGNLLQGPYAFLVGLILGYLACEYSVKWSIALHIFNNLILAEGLNLLMERMSMEMANLFSAALFGGALLLSLVILARNRGRIRMYRRAEWIDRRCVLCFLTNWGFVVFTAVMCINIVSFLLL